MPRLHDTTLVHRSVEQTRAGLKRFFLLLRGKDGVARMRLRVPTDGARNGYAISLDREVRVEAHSARNEGNDDSIRIAWIPEGTMVFPTFEGRLLVRDESDPGVSRIELDGAYAPPFGAAGQLFDVTIGRRIAEATAREFLKDLKASVEG